MNDQKTPVGAGAKGRATREAAPPAADARKLERDREKTARYRARHPEKITAARHKYSAERVTYAKERFTSPFPKLVIASDDFVEACRKAAKLYTFQTGNGIFRWFETLPAALRQEVITAGINRLLPQVRELESKGAKSSDYIAKARAKTNAASLDRYREVKALRRIVEALDAKMVGEKRLGECGRADLLREAARLDGEAQDLTADAALYRELAALIGKQTVREYSDRGKVVALLTSRWGEGEAA